MKSASRRCKNSGISGWGVAPVDPQPFPVVALPLLLPSPLPLLTFPLRRNSVSTLSEREHSPLEKVVASFIIHDGSEEHREIADVACVAIDHKPAHYMVPAPWYLTWLSLTRARADGTPSLWIDLQMSFAASLKVAFKLWEY